MTAGTGIPGLGGCCAHGVGMLDQCDACSSAREIARLSAEVERLRPVVEAAQAWQGRRRPETSGMEYHAACKALTAAVDAYEARGEVR